MFIYGLALDCKRFSIALLSSNQFTIPLLANALSLVFVQNYTAANPSPPSTAIHARKIYGKGHPAWSEMGKSPAWSLLQTPLTAGWFAVRPHDITVHGQSSRACALSLSGTELN